MGIEDELKMPVQRKKEEGSSIELSEAREVLGECESSIGQLKENSSSFRAFTESLENKLASLKREISVGLATPSQEGNSFWEDFKEYVKEVKRLGELVVEINTTVHNLEDKSEKLGGYANRNSEII